MDYNSTQENHNPMATRNKLAMDQEGSPRAQSIPETNFMPTHNFEDKPLGNKNFLSGILNDFDNQNFLDQP